MNTQAMGAFSAVALKQMRSVWSWWLAEIKELFPAVFAGSRRGVAETVFVDLGNEISMLHGYERNVLSGSYELTSLGDKFLQVPPGCKALLDRATCVVARLPADQIVRTELILPRATIGNLRQVLGFEMDRHTPFDADQVYYDFKIKAQVEQNIVVDLVVVRRNTLDALIDKLAHAGISPTVVDIDEGELGGRASPPIVFDLLPVARSPDSQRDGSVVDRWWPWILVSLAVIALALPLAQRYVVKANIAAELESVRASAADVQVTRDELSRQLQPMITFSNLRSRSPRAIVVLDELTRRLPDNTWLSRLEISGNKISMQGESKDAAALISILEESEMFSGARFVSPITRNPTTENDRFVIEVTSATEVAR